MLWIEEQVEQRERAHLREKVRKLLARNDRQEGPSGRRLEEPGIFTQWRNYGS